MPNQCSRKVTPRDSGPFGWLHPKPCSRKGTVERNGHWYCRQHDPVKVAERRAELNHQYQEKRRLETEFNIRKIETLGACDGVTTDQLRPGLLKEALDALREIINIPVDDGDDAVIMTRSLARKVLEDWR